MYLYEKQPPVLQNNSSAVGGVELSPLEKQAKRDNAMSHQLTHLTHIEDMRRCEGGTSST